MLTTDKITEIRARLEKIEPGRWVVLIDRDGDPIVHVGGICENTGDVICECWETKHSLKKDNAEFIANASEDVPFLIDAIEEAMEIIRAQEKVISNSTKANHEIAVDRDRWKARCEELERVISQSKVQMLQQTDATCPNCGVSFLVDVPV